MRSRRVVFGLGVAAAVLGVAGLGVWAGSKPADADVAVRIARGLLAASPLAEPGDAAARDAAGERLAALGPLRAALGPSVVWGGYGGKGLRPSENHTTEFSARTYARCYLSLFMFPGGFEVEDVDGMTVLRMDVRFRYDLDPGDYPYPFWHTAGKWEAYESCTQVILVIDGGRVVAAYRGAEKDPSRPHRERDWNGAWRWTEGGREEPRAALFQSLFSPGNPHVERLDRAYRALEAEMRQDLCFTCHAPDNPSSMSPLTILNLPNQAFGARHEWLRQIEEDRMPPADLEKGTPAGIQDPDRKRRAIELARAFAAVGDAAIAFEEGEADAGLGAGAQEVTR